MVGAVVLSAGASFRMGSPKALLTIDGRTFLEHVVGVLRTAGIREIVIVLGADAEVIRKSLPGLDEIMVVNEKWEQGQLSSIIAGLEAFPPRQPDGVLICPVDRPLMTPPLVTALVSAFVNSKEKIIVPVVHGRRGHPALFPRTRFEDLRNAPAAIGARYLLHQNPLDVIEVLTEEEGATINIDTPEEYRTHIRHERPAADESSV